MSNDQQTPDELAISELYQQLVKEKPSYELDQTILTLAKNGVDKQSVATFSSPQSKVVRPRWRKWQWPMGVAATVIFAWLVVIGQFATFEPMLPSSEQGLPSLKDDAMPISERQRSSAPLATEVALPVVEVSNDNNESESVDRPQMTDYKAIAEQEMIKQRQNELRLVEQALSNNVAKAESPQKLEIELQSAQSVTDEIEAITVTGSRIIVPKQKAEIENVPLKSNQHKPVENVFLESLYTKYQEVANKQGLPESDRAKQLKELQGSIYQYLLQMNMVNPQLPVEQKFYEVLTPQQKESLQLQPVGQNTGESDEHEPGNSR